MKNLEFRVWDTVENIWQDDLYLSMNGFLRWFNGDYLDLTPGEMVIQFSTGLKDMNDKMIFEGDICIFQDWKPKVIEWKNGRYFLGNSLVFLCEMECKSLRTIGNIYDNPELLKKEN